MGKKKIIVSKTKSNTRIGSVLLQANKMSTKESMTAAKTKKSTRLREAVLQQENNMRTKKISKQGNLKYNHKE
jgi:hypothetical protein